MHLKLNIGSSKTVRIVFDDGTPPVALEGLEPNSTISLDVGGRVEEARPEGETRDYRRTCVRREELADVVGVYRASGYSVSRLARVTGCNPLTIRVLLHGEADRTFHQRTVRRLREGVAAVRREGARDAFAGSSPRADVHDALTRRGRVVLSNRVRAEFAALAGRDGADRRAVDRIYDELLARVREALERGGRDRLAEVAAGIGVAWRSVQTVLTGVTAPTVPTLGAMARALAVEVPDGFADLELAAAAAGAGKPPGRKLAADGAKPTVKPDRAFWAGRAPAVNLGPKRVTQS
jgi:hypothetical protein